MAQPHPPGPGRTFTSRTALAVPPMYFSATFELDDTSYADLQGTGGLREVWDSRFNNPTGAATVADLRPAMA